MMDIHYFLRFDEDGYGGHGDGVVHLGCLKPDESFELHLYPECRVASLRDMVVYLKDRLGEFKNPPRWYPRIESEFGDPISFADFIRMTRSSD